MFWYNIYESKSDILICKLDLINLINFESQKKVYIEKDKIGNSITQF
jgi:hypothetical protein